VILRGLGRKIMNKQLVVRILGAVILALTAAAIARELSKPGEKRYWHGKVAGFIPYDFRKPSLDRFKESYWNPYERHVLTPRVFGLGWAINFYALFENLGLIQEGDTSEESFLLPNKRMRQILRPHRTTTWPKYEALNSK
jgi:hypothetical protein